MSERRLSPNKKLQQARLAKGWTQKGVAERIGTDERIVRRWESGKPVSPYYVAKLTELFHASAEDLGLILSMSEQIEPSLPAPQQARLTTSVSASTISDTSMDTPQPSSEDMNRRSLLKRVRATWIDGLLKDSLHQVARIELRLQDRPDVLKNPWRLEVQDLDKGPDPLPGGTSIVQVYDRADDKLLILGEPGAGKTTLLLELADTLLERAEHDEQLPMPVVFNLSSWAKKRLPLARWLIEELWTKYEVPRQIGQDWVEEGQVLPLLDGLDEVAEGARRACVQAINFYYHQLRLKKGSNSLVVCCRSKEYSTLSTRVAVHSAVSILPLSEEQIDSYLGQAGGQVEGLRQALHVDTELHTLALQPLMLNIFTLAYQGATLAEIPSGGTREATLRATFARYVERMLKRRGIHKRWKAEHVIHNLTFLAKQMHRYNQTVFFVENLQPDWLSNKGSRRLYLGLVNALLGALFGTVLFGLLGGIIAGQTALLDWLNPWPLDASVAVPILLLIFGAVLGFFMGSGLGLKQKIEQATIQPIEVLSWSSKKMQWTISQSLIIGGIAGLLNWQLAKPIVPLFSQLFVNMWEQQHNGELLAWLIYEVIDLLIGGVVYALISRLRSHLSVLGMPASRHDIRQGLLVGLLIGLFASQFDGLMGGPTYNNFVHPLLGQSLFAPLGRLITGGSSGLLAGVVFGVLIGFSRNRLDKSDHVVANQGIHRSLRYSIIMGVIIWGLFWAIFLLVSGLEFKLFLGLLCGLLLGLFFGLLNGGIACIQHAFLRYFLWRDGHIPLNYVRFLDYASERILLRKVGGGYIFVHRQLLDYFASLEEQRL